MRPPARAAGRRLRAAARNRNQQAPAVDRRRFGGLAHVVFGRAQDCAAAFRRYPPPRPRQAPRPNDLEASGCLPAANALGRRERRSAAAEPALSAQRRDAPHRPFARLAVSPAASSTISAVISSCRTKPLRRPQLVELAVDLAPRRRHRLDPRLVLGGEGVERGVAQLGVQEVEGEIANAARRAAGSSAARRRASAARRRRSRTGTGAGAPPSPPRPAATAEDRFQLGRPRRRRSPLRSRRACGRRAGRRLAAGPASPPANARPEPRSAASAAPRAPTRKTSESARSPPPLEHPLAEGAGEALFGDEQDQRPPRRAPPRRAGGGGASASARPIARRPSRRSCRPRRARRARLERAPRRCRASR